MIGRAIGFLVSWFFRVLGAVFVLSLIWVIAYRFLPPPMTWLMARDSVDGRKVQYTWVPLTAMSRSLPRAVIGAEDANGSHRRKDAIGIAWVEHQVMG